MTPEPPHRAREDTAGDPAPVAEFGGWAVKIDGTLVCQQHRVTIYPDRLAESDWWLNLSERRWMRQEWNDFIPAFRRACEVAGIESVNLKMIVE